MVKGRVPGEVKIKARMPHPGTDEEREGRKDKDQQNGGPPEGSKRECGFATSLVDTKTPSNRYDRV